MTCPVVGSVVADAVVSGVLAVLDVATLVVTVAVNLNEDCVTAEEDGAAERAGVRELFSNAVVESRLMDRDPADGATTIDVFAAKTDKCQVKLRSFMRRHKNLGYTDSVVRKPVQSELRQTAKNDNGGEIQYSQHRARFLRGTYIFLGRFAVKPFLRAKSWSASVTSHGRQSHPSSWTPVAVSESLRTVVKHDLVLCMNRFVFCLQQLSRGSF